MALIDTQDNAVIYHGESPAQVLLADDVKAGDALGYNVGWRRATATAGSIVQIRCVAGEDGVSGQTITAYFGTCVIGGNRFSNALPNGSIYVAEDDGQYTQTEPTTLGAANTVVGVAITSTLVVINPAHNCDSVVRGKENGKADIQTEEKTA